ncbi:MAG: bifunctional [glutamine synthetase] adenylyltransferase/[glutamine synthetase]-adenylyl-L-tyrosine phosphorylase [Hyphomicrobiaceae bacterium]
MTHVHADSLAARIREVPLAPEGEAGARLACEVAELRASAGDAGTAADVLGDPMVQRLVAGVLAGSPYLAGLSRRDPERLARVLSRPPEARLDDLIAATKVLAREAPDQRTIMAGLRQFKNEAALLIALADLGGVWSAMEVTRALTRTADAAVAASLAFLFRQAVAKGDWLDDGKGEGHETRSGYFVLAMGKHGAYELNYSSDIDLIVFFEPGLSRVREGLEPQAFFVRVTRDLVKLMQERTGDGYVFRTDLRLRPDPGATQVALSTVAAFGYYESVGQNWERAALIKARPCAGDVAAGEAFLAELAPYVWRKYLDFAAIADIHAMKRQIHSYRGFGRIAVAGHNIKLGRGGIREIEFFAQTQQLIAGGRQRELRCRATLEALARLAERGWITTAVEADLARAYRFLRRLEHRLQMVADEQTHAMPSAPADLERLARFAGFAGTAALSDALVAELTIVEQHYAALFENVPELTRSGANMVFAGEDDDPGTVAALAKLGYSQPTQVLATVRSWHRGRYPAMRSAKARERLTEVQPVLIEALAETANPDAALAGFDRFLSALPAGIQLFALLRNTPALLRVIADIMGTAPRLARILSRRRRVIDALLDPRTMADLPDAAEIGRVVRAELAGAEDLQDCLDRARVIGGEQAFLIGVRVLMGLIGASQAGVAYAALAEAQISALSEAVTADFERVHGRVPGGGAVILALGKLGGREMTAASDLDLIVVYDFDPEAQASDGVKPLPVSQYYARLTQRIVSALSAPTAEGSLYDVDMRLRPSGQKGPVATQLESFNAYQRTEAWTWEHMALTRARVVAGQADLAAKVEATIREVLTAPRDAQKLRADVRDMRQRIAAEKGTADIWDLKQVRGGLVDIEFITQYLQLVHAAGHPEVLDQGTIPALQKLAHLGLLADADDLAQAARLEHDLTQVLRLCFEGPFRPDEAPDGLKALLARVGGEPGFAQLEGRLRHVLAETAATFERIVADGS